MQHLGVKFGGIWRFELGFFTWVLGFFWLNKSGLIFKSTISLLFGQFDQKLCVEWVAPHAPMIFARIPMNTLQLCR